MDWQQERSSRRGRESAFRGRRVKGKKKWIREEKVERMNWERREKRRSGCGRREDGRVEQRRV